LKSLKLKIESLKRSQETVFSVQVSAFSFLENYQNWGEDKDKIL